MKYCICSFSITVPRKAKKKFELLNTDNNFTLRTLLRLNISLPPMYKKEIINNKFNIILISIVIILSYSVYLFNEKIVILLGSEDNLYEGGTALFLFISSIFFLLSSPKNIFMILLSLIFFFGAGEELSWGQRIFCFEVPENIKQENVQSEFNVHNLPTFNGATNKNSHKQKQGIQRLIEMNFLYRVFLLIFGILLPLACYHIAFFKKLVKQLKIPVPPITIGIFLGISWLACKLILNILPKGYNKNYYFAANEIWEFLTAFIIANFGYYFYHNRKHQILGADIKDTSLIQ